MPKARQTTPAHLCASGDALSADALRALAGGGSGMAGTSSATSTGRKASAMSELTPYVANFCDQSLDVWRVLVQLDWQEGVCNLPFHALNPVFNTVPASYQMQHPSSSAMFCRTVAP